jgi:hypothetical protein
LDSDLGDILDFCPFNDKEVDDDKLADGEMVIPVGKR